MRKLVVLLLMVTVGLVSTAIVRTPDPRPLRLEQQVTVAELPELAIPRPRPGSATRDATSTSATHAGAEDPIRSSAQQTRTVTVRVLSENGAPVTGATVVVEARLHHRSWAEVRRLRTDRCGLASAQLIDSTSPRRVRLLGDTRSTGLPATPASPIVIRTAATIPIILELTDSTSVPLLGAQAVTAIVAGIRYHGFVSRWNEARWRVLIPEPTFAGAGQVAARIEVEDTLGRTWTSSVTLRPFERHRVEPSPDVAVLRSHRMPLREAVLDRTGHGVRLRWSLELASERVDGSTWLRSTGFHTVATRTIEPTTRARLSIHATSSSSASMRHLIRWPLAERSIAIHSCSNRFETL